MKKYALYTLVTDDVFESACLMIYSFLSNNYWFYKNGYDIVILTESNRLSEKNKKNINLIYPHMVFNCVDIKPYKKIIEHFEHSDKRFDVCWLKIELFKENIYDKILYLDSDMIIINDIFELFDNDDDILFCEDQCEIKQTLFNTTKWERKGEYFNAGLIGINKKWITEHSYSDILSKAVTCQCDDLKYKGLYPEQDYLNSLIEGGTLYPSIIYNASQHIILNEKNVRNFHTKIIHFLGNKKPWHNEGVMEVHKYYNAYKKLWENGIKFEDIGNFYNEDILCAIINYNNDEGAVDLYKKLSPYMMVKIYDTYHKENGDIIKQIGNKDIEYLNNVQYGGAYRYAWNESLFFKKKYTMVITSDVIIDDNNARILGKIMRDRSFLSGIGCYGLSCSYGSKVYGSTTITDRNKNLHNLQTGNIREVNELEGWCMVVNNVLLNEVAEKITLDYNIGWAYDQTLTKLAQKRGMLNVVDDRVTAYHKAGRGYNPYKAEAQFNLFKKNYWSKTFEI